MVLSFAVMFNSKVQCNEWVFDIFGSVNAYLSHGATGVNLNVPSGI